MIRATLVAVAKVVGVVLIARSSRARSLPAGTGPPGTEHLCQQA